MTVIRDYAREAEAFASWLIADTTKGQRKRDGPWVRGRCPRPDHEDRRPSFGYNADSDGYQCSCGGGKGSELRAELGFITNGHPVPKQTHRVIPKSLTLKESPAPDRPPDCAHEYANGNRKLKWRGEPKTVRWEHLVDGAWKAGMSGDPGLYLQSSIALSDLVCLCESETDAEALMHIGFWSVAVPFGAQAALRKGQAELFKGKTVAVFQQRDDAGKEFWEKCSDVLATATEEVFAVLPPEKHKDVRDWIEAGADRAAIDAAIDAAAPKEFLALPASKLLPEVDDHVDWILEPLIASESLTEIQGRSKAGKSAFATYIAMSIAWGRWFADRFDYHGDPRRVLYLAYEDNLRRIKRRIVQYRRGLGIESGFPDNLLLFQKQPEIDLATPAGAAYLDKIVRKNKPDVLFIDTISWLFSGDENKKEVAHPVMAAIRGLLPKYRIAIAFVHHTRKPAAHGDQGAVSERGRGSSAIAAAPDTIIDFGARVQPNVTLCALTSKDAQDQEWLCKYDQNEETDEVIWTMMDAEEREDLSKVRQTIADAVKNLLVTSQDGFTKSTLAAVLPGISEPTLRRHLKTLVAKKELEMLEGQGPKRCNLFKKFNPVTPRYDGA